MLDRRASTHLLEGLQCGTRYQFTLAAFNRIGSGSASDIQTAKTNGSKPVPPPKYHFVKPNQTFVILELAAWQDGGCPLTYFVVEYRRQPGDWLLGKNLQLFGKLKSRSEEVALDNSRKHDVDRSELIPRSISRKFLLVRKVLIIFFFFIIVRMV